MGFFTRMLLSIGQLVLRKAEELGSYKLPLTLFLNLCWGHSGRYLVEEEEEVSQSEGGGIATERE